MSKIFSSDILRKFRVSFAPRRVGRPDGSATGSTPEVPIGDAVLPFLLLAFAFVLFRRHKHAQQVR